MKEFIFLNWKINCDDHSLLPLITELIGHHARLRDTVGQSYPIYACTRANHARYSAIHVTFCGSWKHSLLK